MTKYISLPVGRYGELFLRTMSTRNTAAQILVVRLSSMGDVVLAASIFDALNGRFPGCSITMLSAQPWGTLFEQDPRVYRVVYRDDDAAVASLGSIWWDAIVDLQNNRHTRTLCRRLSCTGWRGRFNKRHGRRLLLLGLRTGSPSSVGHVIERYHQAAGFRVAAPDCSTRLIISAVMIDACRSRFLPRDCTQTPVLALFPFSAWRNKEWPRSSFARVAAAFVLRGWNVVIFGGPGDRGAGKELAAAVDHAACRSLAGHTTLVESAACICSCSLALGNDTGLSHVARACGVPTGMLFGSTTRHLGFFPVGNPPFTVFELPLWCRPCHAHGGNVCLRGGRPCLERMGWECVVAKLWELYQQSSS